MWGRHRGVSSRDNRGRRRATAGCLVALALASVTGCGGQPDQTVQTDQTDPTDQTDDDGAGADRDETVDDEASDNEPQDEDAGSSDATVTFDEVLTQAEAAMSGSWQVTYDAADGREVIVANDGDELAVAIDGEVVLRLTPSGPMSCAGGQCMLLPMDADTPLGQLLQQDLGPAAAGFDLARVDGAEAVEVETDEVAGRPASCVTMGAAALSAAPSAADGTATVCVDVETGAVLRSQLGDDVLEATAVSTTPDQSLFIQ